jgi:integrase/recombinase XerD
MESERRLSSFTVRTRLYQTGRFLRWFSRCRAKRQLALISLKDVDGYFSAMVNQWSRVSLSSVAAILRAFFLYAEGRRRCSAGIARGIKGPPIRPDSSAVGGPKWKEVLKLLRTTKGRTPVAIRAQAVLQLLSLYGLRRGEIVRLQLSDFDWPNDIFTVRRSKRGGLQQFPLRREVSNSILRYIWSARPPSSCKHVGIQDDVRARLTRLLVLGVAQWLCVKFIAWGRNAFRPL